MANIKNDWQESDIVMNTDMNDIANAINSKLNSDFSNVSGGAVPIENGGTGATTAENAKNNLGLGDTAVPQFGALELFQTTPFVDFHYNNTSDDYNIRIINDADKTLSITADGGAILKINGNHAITTSSDQYNLCSLELNGTNIDTDFERNYTTGISENGYGTRPNGGWQNVFNIVGGHFRAQIAIEAHAGSNADVNMWIRSKYLDSGWSNWICATKIFVQETQPSYAVNGSLWAW